MNRRKFVTTASSLTITGLAGCSTVGNQIESVGYDEDVLVVSLNEDHNVNRLEVLSGDDSRIHSSNVGTETRVELFNIITGPSGFALRGVEYIGETLTITAVDSEGNSVGDVEIEYTPELEAEDLEINFREGEIQFTVTNVGEGPLNVHPDVGFTEVEQITPEVDFLATGLAAINDEPAEETVIDYPSRLITNSGLETFLLSNGGNKRVTIDIEPIIGFVEESPDPSNAYETRGTESIIVSEPIETEEVPLDKNEANAILQIELGNGSPELAKSYQVELNFSDIIGHIGENFSRNGGYQYAVALDAGDVEIVSFEEVELS